MAALIFRHFSDGRQSVAQKQNWFNEDVILIAEQLSQVSQSAVRSVLLRGFVVHPQMVNRIAIGTLYPHSEPQRRIGTRRGKIKKGSGRNAMGRSETEWG